MSEKSVEEESEVPKAVLQTNSDPPQEAKPIVAVFSSLVKFLVDLTEGIGWKRKAMHRVVRFLEFGNLRQALFLRDLKAVNKYGTGLSLEDGPAGLKPIQDKMADSVFFMEKFLMAPQTKRINRHLLKSQLDTLKDLQLLINVMMERIEQEIK